MRSIFALPIPIVPILLSETDKVLADPLFQGARLIYSDLEQLFDRILNDTEIVPWWWFEGGAGNLSRASEAMPWWCSLVHPC